MLLLPAIVALHVAGDGDAGFTVAARVRVLGVLRITRKLHAAGSVRARPTVPAAAPRAEQAPPAEPHAPPTAADRAARWQARARKLLDRLALVRRVLERGAVRIVQPSGWIDYALADVAETGRLYGFVCATSVLFDPAGAVTVRPLWTAANWLALDLTLAARVYPLRLGAVLAGEWRAQRRRARAAARPPLEQPRAA